MNALALQAEGIRHRYGKLDALQDITFNLPAGTRCGLIGLTVPASPACSG